MQLKIKRSQRDGGIISKTAIFCLDARVQFTQQEQQSIQRYKLGGQVIYNSEASQRLIDKANAQNDGSLKGSLKGLASLAMANLKLNISINSLAAGQHVECKSLDELLGAEEAVMTACQNLKGYLDTAATFDGREVLFDFESGQAEAVAHVVSPNPALIAPPSDAARTGDASPAPPMSDEIIEDAQYEAIPDAPTPEPDHDDGGTYQSDSDFAQYITQKNVLIVIFALIFISMLAKCH